MTYQDQLQHPRWKKKKAQIIADSGGTCMVCRCTDRPLHVHHCAYIAGRMLWEYPDELLTPLCEVCHDLQHPYGDSRATPKHKEGWDHTSVDAFIELFYSFQWN